MYSFQGGVDLTNYTVVSGIQCVISHFPFAVSFYSVLLLVEINGTINLCNLPIRIVW